MASGKYGTFSGGRISVVGLDEYVAKLTKFDADIESVVEKAIDKSVIPVTRDMEKFLDKHLVGQPRPVGQKTLPRGRGTTKQNMYVNKKWKNRHTYLQVEVGFHKGDSKHPEGLPALFLDIGTKDAIGTPLIKPTFFVYYAVHNNVNEVQRIQTSEVENVYNILSGAKK